MRVERLLAYLETPTHDPALAQHVMTCPACQRRLARLSRAVLAPYATPITCAECEAQLPEYVQAQIETGTHARVFPAVAAHLARCHDCWRLYADLLAVAALAARGELPRPESYKPPDLSFLQRPFIGKHLSDIVRRGSHWVQDGVQGLFIDLGALWHISGLQVEPARAVRQRVTDDRDVVYPIKLGPETLANLDVEVAVFRQPEQVEMANVVVIVHLPGRLLEGFAGSKVQMETATTTRTQITDEYGHLEFKDVPLSELDHSVLAIVPPNYEIR